MMKFADIIVEGKVFDITLIIGLRIFKVHSVESRQPPARNASRSDAGGPPA